jgi:hypothetical protein
LPLCPPQIPHGLTQVWTQDSVVSGQRLTAWATAWPINSVREKDKNVHW